MSKGLLGLAAGAVLTLLFAVACGADATNTPVPTRVPATPTTAAGLPTPLPTAITVARPSGTLTIAMEDIGDGVGLPSAASDYNKHWALESPLRKTFDGRIVGGLVESWDVSADGSKITLHIRKGTPFHTTFGDWGDVTAEDIQWSMESVGQVGSSSWRWDAFTPITQFEIPDPYTLITHLPLKDFFLLMDSVYQSKNLGINITSQAFHESASEAEAFNHYVGTGPWDHLQTQSGEFMKFQAVEDHYQKTPDFAFLEVREIPEAASRLAAVSAGEADITKVSGTFVGEATRLGLTLSPGSGGACVWLQLGGLVLTDRPTFNPNTSPDGIPWVGDPASADSMERALKVRKALNVGEMMTKASAKSKATEAIIKLAKIVSAREETDEGEKKGGLFKRGKKKDKDKK
ncbi:MAG: hypothetical protein IH994_11345 [Proteobacteria bacterium]|nr:hypothetical protein [Pseudomonadota bacterium]